MVFSSFVEFRIHFEDFGTDDRDDISGGIVEYGRPGKALSYWSLDDNRVGAVGSELRNQREETEDAEVSASKRKSQHKRPESQMPTT
jgi:hypothetical protein